jgi:hypothetical protein
MLRPLLEFSLAILIAVYYLVLTFNLSISNFILSTSHTTTISLSLALTTLTMCTIKIPIMEIKFNLHEGIN